MKPVAYVTLGLAAFGYVAILGSVISAIWALVRLLTLQKPMRLFANKAELRLLVGSFSAACLGSLWLFVAPAYGGMHCASSISVQPVETHREISQGTDGESIETVTYSSTATSIVRTDIPCEKRGRTFLEVNGPAIIPLFTVPILFTLVPFAFYALRVRPLIEALMAFLLGAQMAIGMSAYGTAFGPAGVLMLVASIMGARTRDAQQIVAADV